MTQGVVLHQTLHGYEDGHRLIASSVQLQASDAKTLLHLSDSAGSSVRSEGDEYITGYPLSKSGLYAIARTWAAPEKPRPGCVWTHTLLVEFADLALIPDVSCFSGLFVRPSSSDISRYKRPLTLSSVRTTSSIPASEVTPILAALYGNPAARVVAKRQDREQSETLAFGIWSQQWPRLRRSFRFCTNATSDRSTDGNPFDLQFSPHEGSIGSRFPKAVAVSSASTPLPLWIEHALSDFTHPDAAGLRSFLHGVGGDVDRGRASFASLVQLHADLRGINDNFALLANAIHLLTSELRDVEAVELRRKVALSASERISALDEAGVGFVVDNLHLLSHSAVDEGSLGQALMRRSPKLFSGMLTASGKAMEVAKAGLKKASTEDAVEFAAADLESSDVVLSVRPDLYGTVEFWWKAELATSAAVAAAKVAGRPAQSTVVAMVAARRTDLVKSAFENYGHVDVLGALATMEGEVERLATPWLIESVRDHQAVAQVLASGVSYSVNFLPKVARLIGPDDVPNDYGEDPWLIALRRRSKGPLDLYLGAYLFARALGTRSRNSAELAVFGFSEVHEATARGTLGDDAWSLISPRLPNTLLGFDWDRCWRLRAGLVDLFVDRDLPSFVFATAGFNDELFFALVNWGCRSKRGRGFMKGVVGDLRAEGSLKRAREVERLAEDKWPF